MTLTLEVTGEAIEEGRSLTNLKLDEKNMLGTESEALRKIIEQIVYAMNALYQQVEKQKEDDEQLQDATQHLEQQISSFEVRSRECEDTCQEIRLQLGTMVQMAERIPEKEEMEVRKSSDVTHKDLTDILQKMDQVASDVDTVKRSLHADMNACEKKIAEIEDVMHRHQEFFDDDLEGRLAQNDDDRALMKADLEALRQSVDDLNNRKASKVEVGDIAHHVYTLSEGQSANNKLLQEAGQQFTKLDGLAHLVTENQSKMQEMWSMFGKESQELREWASTGLLQLRSAVQAKMGEQEALSHVAEIRKEVRDLGPYLSEATARLEGSLIHKAEASDLQRLQDEIEAINKSSGRPKQLLVGTKCLACNRTVTTADSTDAGPVSLEERRQEEELWKEVQRALDKKPEQRQLGQKDVLKYVAIHVGDPASATVGGHGRFEGRTRRDDSLGGPYLMRVGGGGGVFSRPQTHSGVERSPPREVPPLYRVPPRRPGKLGPPVLETVRDANRPVPNKSVRKMLGTNQMPPAPVDPTVAPPIPPDSQYSSVRMQPAAHSGMAQPQATDYDFDIESEGEAYVIRGGSPDSR